MPKPLDLSSSDVLSPDSLPLSSFFHCFEQGCREFFLATGHSLDPFQVALQFQTLESFDAQCHFIAQSFTSLSDHDRLLHAQQSVVYFIQGIEQMKQQLQSSSSIHSQHHKALKAYLQDS